MASRPSAAARDGTKTHTLLPTAGRALHRSCRVSCAGSEPGRLGIFRGVRDLRPSTLIAPSSAMTSYPSRNFGFSATSSDESQESPGETSWMMISGALSSICRRIHSKSCLWYYSVRISLFPVRSSRRILMCIECIVRPTDCGSCRPRQRRCAVQGETQPTGLAKSRVRRCVSRGGTPRRARVPPVDYGDGLHCA
jgi:hypothetical protein